MGQVVSVFEQPSSDPGVVRLELNRTLTGMAHETYVRGTPVHGNRPPDVLARLLFEEGERVRRVHMYSNQVTIELEPWSSGEGLAEIVRELYVHYKPGVTPSLP
jgi:hypothetical protein